MMLKAHTLAVTLLVAAATRAAAQGGYGDGEMGACEGVCEYLIKVDMQWSPENHPIDFPTDPQGFFSPFYTVAHDDSFVVWRDGETSSPGIQMIAETGAGDAFLEEVAACGDSCSEPVTFMCSPMSGVCTGEGTITVSPTLPYLSTATMLAPSPDWFTGLDSWPLCKDGEWVKEMSQDVNAYDAGTDVGPGFLSEDMPNAVKSEIFSFGGVMPPEASIFYNPSTGMIAPVGTISVELIGCE